MEITKQYLIEQIERVENIIKNAKNELKLVNYCTKNEVKDLKTIKDTANYKAYREECSKYNLSEIQYNYFKHSCLYKNFKKEILINYLESIVDKAYKLELLDNNFSY